MITLVRVERLSLKLDLNCLTSNSSFLNSFSFINELKTATVFSKINGTPRTLKNDTKKSVIYSFLLCTLELFLLTWLIKFKLASLIVLFHKYLHPILLQSHTDNLTFFNLTFFNLKSSKLTSSQY